MYTTFDSSKPIHPFHVFFFYIATVFIASFISPEFRNQISDYLRERLSSAIQHQDQTLLEDLIKVCIATSFPE